ncbi:ESX secretion-associated protein EspG [Nocardia sp. NBC_01730]|uniref:ESX secretion-associated protein EspG n=1 Tax=Nocardia sp. NBC_01730 TaxID=2975998 RepID=UPI002E11531B|nr:ESX secretion-associated protein EspG [Nocardia sp. NBC_01730]
MDRSWTLTDVEFVVAWDRMRELRLPAPFTALVRDLDWDEQYEERQAWLGLRTRWSSGLDEVFDIVAKPDLRIIAHGWDQRAAADPTSHIRLHAIRRADRGYLLEQIPGRTTYDGGRVTITECDCLSLAERIAARLPAEERGQFDNVVLPRRSTDAEFDAEFGASMVREPKEAPVDQHGAELLRKPVARRGIVEVRQGVTRFGPRNLARRGLWWRDIADDGRYVITPGSPAIATGVDTARLVSSINRAVADVIRLIKDERR